MKKNSIFKRCAAGIFAFAIILSLANTKILSEKNVVRGTYKSDEKNAVCADEDVITLRVCNWEEYIDEGDWDEDELIELDSCSIIGENHMAEDFEEWYFETYGKKVKVEYSCFGTNEDLYNMLNLGDVYDLVCPSEYMIMKFMAEDRLVPYSEDFFDESDENNYYTRGVAPFIKENFEKNEINGEPWKKYAAGYMWGITGIVYNPEVVTKEEASTWNILNNSKFKRQVTIKDNVRDTYFAALGIVKQDLLTSEEFLNDPDYHDKLAVEMNDVSEDTVAEVQDLLQKMQDNVYSFETDSGKADMVSGKVVANYQWSGDAVYTMDQADEDDVTLNFAAPKEGVNLYFDGWVMLKSGVEGDAEKQHAAEAFVNFLSRPDNVVRNMYYIGYTPVISGPEGDTTIFEYVDWCYGAEEDEEDTVEYPLGFYFSGDENDEDYVITTSADQLDRQLGAQYPEVSTINSSAIMQYFDADASKRTNQMWINVRCYNINEVSTGMWIFVGLVVLAFVGLIIGKKVKK